MKKYKKLLGVGIPHNCDYCQNCVVEGGTNFCKFKKSINKKGICKKFDYNPVMRKIQPPIIPAKFDESDFTL